MGAGAEVSLLGYAGTRADLHSSKAIGMGAITQTGLVVQGEVPGVINAGPLMHKGLAVKGGPKAAQDEKTPRITGFGRPTAEQRPSNLPEQLAQAMAAAPRAGVATGLGVGTHQKRRCWIRDNRKLQSDRQSVRGPEQQRDSTKGYRLNKA